ncbi:MAG: hypothetical protein PHQ42_04330 [Patescibacteria group bacterium]|nr:hypothetical protein [Patescibacteria group bacterium]
MLAPKKIEKNKLIIYIAVIAFMVMGTGFFIYKNYSLTAAKKSANIELPAEMDWREGDSSEGFFEETGPEEAVGSGEGSGENLEIKDPDKEKELLDLGLLSEAKFKKLRENIVEEENFEAGKSNPFTSD